MIIWSQSYQTLFYPLMHNLPVFCFKACSLQCMKMQFIDSLQHSSLTARIWFHCNFRKLTFVICPSIRNVWCCFSMSPFNHTVAPVNKDKVNSCSSNYKWFLKGSSKIVAIFKLQLLKLKSIQSLRWKLIIESRE